MVVMSHSFVVSVFSRRPIGAGEDDIIKIYLYVKIYLVGGRISSPPTAIVRSQQGRHIMKRLFGRHEAPAESFPVSHTEEEWRQRLDPAQFHVLRKHGTERAGTSTLNAEKRAGMFVCAGCGKPLFPSATKFESGTGWPSFTEPLDGAVGRPRTAACS